MQYEATGATCKKIGVKVPPDRILGIQARFIGTIKRLSTPREQFEAKDCTYSLNEVWDVPSQNHAQVIRLKRRRSLPETAPQDSLNIARCQRNLKPSQEDLLPSASLLIHASGNLVRKESENGTQRVIPESLTTLLREFCIFLDSILDGRKYLRRTELPHYARAWLLDHFGSGEKINDLSESDRAALFDTMGGIASVQDYARRIRAIVAINRQNANCRACELEPTPKFRPSQGYPLIGWAPIQAEVNDHIFVLHGVNIPMAMRKVDDEHFVFVGQTYVQGIMNGEAMESDHLKDENILVM